MKEIKATQGLIEKRISEAAAVLIAVAFLCMSLFSQRQDLVPDSNMAGYSSGWEYRYGEKAGTVDLPVILPVSENTVITLKKTLPEKLNDSSGIVFRTRMQRVRVYIDGEMIYRYPSQNMIGDAVPSIWNFVKLSEEAAGKQIEICLESPYSGFSGKIEEIRIGNYNELISDTVTDQLPTFMLSLSIGILGALVLLLSILYRRYQLYGYQRMLGIVLVFLSLWLCGESRMVFWKTGLEAWHYITFISLLMYPLFLLSYLYARWREVSGNTTRILFYVCGAVEILCLISQAAGGPDLVEFLPVSHVLSGVTLAYTVFIYIKAKIQGVGGFDRSELVCILLIFAAGIAELVRFYLTDSLVGIYIRSALLVYALDLLLRCVDMLYRKLKENRELEQELKKSRAELITSQIKPHFIYNTLNSIRTLIRVDPDTAYQTVYDFSTYLRSNLDMLGVREMIPFRDEMRHIQAYLNIEKIRFGDRLNVETEIETGAFCVPPLSIQPLVENAVKHGICRKVGGGTVKIHSFERESCYIVSVEDDGAGFDAAEAEGKSREQGKSGSGGSGLEEKSHIGIQSIRFRVEMIAGGTLEIQSKPGEGTKVQVFFPKEGQG